MVNHWWVNLCYVSPSWYRKFELVLFGLPKAHQIPSHSTLNVVKILDNSQEFVAMKCCELCGKLPAMGSLLSNFNLGH